MTAPIVFVNNPDMHVDFSEERPQNGELLAAVRAIYDATQDREIYLPAINGTLWERVSADG